jgi:hypothetical protein
MSSPTPTPNILDPAWDVYLDSQSFNVTGPDGTPTTLSFPIIDSWIHLILLQGIENAFNVGFASMLMIVLAILTNPTKRKRSIFILNYGCLFILVLRGILGLVVLNEEQVYGIGEGVLSAYEGFSLASQDGCQISFNVLSLILTALIFLSLILQTRIVFSAEPLTRTITTVVLSLAAMLIQGFWMYYQIILDWNALSRPRGIRSWVPYAWSIIQIGSVCFTGLCCLIFMSKLLLAIRYRYRAGLRQFGAFHIMVIMFGQCCIVPSIFPGLPKLTAQDIFYILAITTSLDNVRTLGQTFLVCSLPLSALWASQDSVENANPGRGTLATTISTLSSRVRRRFFKRSNDNTQSAVEEQPGSVSDGTPKMSNIDVLPVPEKEEQSFIV